MIKNSIFEKQIQENEIGRIELTFKNLKEKNQKAFIPFITGGFPDMEKFSDLFLTLDRSGADIIEIGIPFSDPLADGPILQQSSMIAIKNRVNVNILFDSIKEFRKHSQIPIILMTYFNAIYAYNPESFLVDAKKSGADGIIIPDLPIEEFYKYKKMFRNNNLDNILLVTLNSPEDRMIKIIKEGRGFLYCVSIRGVTGVRDEVDAGVKIMLKKLKKHTNLPLCSGFGISSLKQISELKEYSDGIIIGSKIISMFLGDINFKEALLKLEKFSKEINQVLKNN